LKRVDQISSAIILSFAALYLLESSKLPLWKGTTFGSGLFPMILGIILVVVSALSLLKATAAKGNLSMPEGMVPPKAGIIALIYVIGSLVAYTLLLELLGFILSTFALLSVLFIALEPTKKRESFALAGAVVAVTYVLFVLLLKLQLPRGLIG
jgi:putative tricarboxylic transport membrane protein